MKAISIRQPWATWIALGLKSTETRTWKTKHRGPLLICASKTVDKDAVAQALKDGYPPYEKAAFPTGVAVAIVEVVDCRPMVPADTAAALCLPTPGRYAWPLADIRAIRPFQVKGQLSIFEVDTRCPCLGKPISSVHLCSECGGTGDKIQPLTKQEVTP